MKSALFATSVFILAACQPDLSNIDLEEVRSGTPCGADKLQHLVGKNIDSDLTEGVVDRPYNLVMPGQPVISNMVPTRLNIAHDANGTVLRVYCG